MRGNANEGNSHLRNMLNQAAVQRPEEVEDEGGLPSIEASAYLPHARPTNNPIFSIHFVTPAGDVRSFQYVHLDSNSEFNADKIVLTFLGIEPTRVTIEGRNLWRLYDYIHQHRMPWIKVAARDFANDGQTIVSRVTYAAVKTDEK